MSIRKRLLFLIIGLAASLVAIGFFNLWGFRQISRAQLDESIEGQAKLAASAFEQRILSYRQTLETIAVLSSRGEQNSTLNDYLSSIIKTRPEIIDLRIIDTTGNILLSQPENYQTIDSQETTEITKEAEKSNGFVITTEQPADRKLRLLSLALTSPDGKTIIARVKGENASEVFENLSMPEDTIIAVFDRNNRLLYRSHVSPEQMSLDLTGTPLLLAINENRKGTVEIESPYDGIRRVYGLAHVNAANSTVIVGVPSARLYEPAQRQFTRQIFLGAMIAVIAIVAAYFLARSITHPIERLSIAAQRFGSGDLEARAGIAKGGAVGNLGSTFDQMAEEIAQREEQLKILDKMKSEFVSNVSHELRTPLTTIKTFVRVLQSDKITPEERTDYLETIAAECDRQIDFVKNLLNLSQIESGAYKIELAPVDSVAILREAVQRYQGAAVTRKLKLIYHSPKLNLPFALTDARALRQVISCLIENAIKYTPEGGKVSVEPVQKNDLIAIDIKDNGCGIAEDDLPHIFEKFYRGKPLESPNWQTEQVGNHDNSDCSSAENESAGVGLGLYLAQSLIEQSGGEIIVESPIQNSERGTRFTVKIPIAK